MVLQIALGIVLGYFLIQLLPYIMEIIFNAKTWCLLSFLFALGCISGKDYSSGIQVLLLITLPLLIYCIKSHTEDKKDIEK